MISVWGKTVSTSAKGSNELSSYFDVLWGVYPSRSRGVKWPSLLIWMPLRGTSTTYLSLKGYQIERKAWWVCILFNVPLKGIQIRRDAHLMPLGGWTPQRVSGWEGGSFEPLAEVETFCPQYLGIRLDIINVYSLVGQLSFLQCKNEKRYFYIVKSERWGQLVKGYIFKN